MEMGQQQVCNVGGVDVDPHQLQRRPVPTIDQEMPAVIEREQNGGVTALRVRECGAGSEHDDPHCSVSLLFMALHSPLAEPLRVKLSGPSEGSITLTDMTGSAHLLYPYE